jgi:hypothetical protein
MTPPRPQLQHVGATDLSQSIWAGVGSSPDRNMSTDATPTSVALLISPIPDARAEERENHNDVDKAI